MSANYDQLSKQELVDELRRRDMALASEEQTVASLKLLETIHLAQTEFVNVESEANVFHQMLQTFLQVTGSEYGFIDELFEENGERWLEARSITNIAWDDDSRALYEKLVSGEIRFDNMNSLYGQVLKTGKPMIANDAPTNPYRTGIPPGHPPLDRFLGLPLYAGGEFVGMLGLANAPGGFDEAMIQYLDPLAKVCAIMLLSFKIEQRRQKAIAQLGETNAELADFNELAVGRELAMIELKREVNDVCRLLGEPERYELAGM